MGSAKNKSRLMLGLYLIIMLNVVIVDAHDDGTTHEEQDEQPNTGLIATIVLVLVLIFTVIYKQSNKIRISFLEGKT